MSGNASTTISAQESIWSKIGNFFKHAGVVISAWFTDIFGANAAHTFATGAEALLETELGKIAWTAVNDAQKLSTGAEKAAAAAASIEAAAKQAGLTVKTSLVNMLIEVAVQKLQGAFGGGAAAAA